MDTRFLGQFLLLGLPGPELDRATQRVVQDLQPGGFILFSRNIEDTRQVREFTDTLRKLCTYEPIVCIDEEGGRVSRLGNLGVSTPSPATLAAAGDPGFITMHARVSSSLLRLLGINLNLAPVLDFSLGSDEADGTLRQRCWGDESQAVIGHAHVLISEIQKNGVLACAKHFPTYTGARVDPHDDLPSIKGDLASMNSACAAPYLALADQLAAVMTAHVLLPDIPETAGQPASLSPAIVNGFLRNQLGFDGLVMTDDLDMGAIRNRRGLPEAAAEAILAGNDLAMICHHPEESFAVRERLGKLPHAVLEDALLRIEKFRKRMPKPIAFRQDRWDAAIKEAAELVEEVAGHSSGDTPSGFSAVETY
ncbi:MAG: glycoside hydrolase family 3 N-terminal domain-containing protein [Verrucomicrobiales bacterium]